MIEDLIGLALESSEFYVKSIRMILRHFEHLRIKGIKLSNFYQMFQRKVGQRGFGQC